VKWIIVVGLLVAAALLVWTFIEKPRVTSRLYRIGWENDPPEQFPDIKGQPTGLAIELVREAARRSGIQLQWVQRNDSSEAALRSGVDLWPLMTITPERAKILHISAPYLESIGCLLVRRASAFERVEDLAKGTVGYLGLPITSRQAHALMPDARLIALRSPGDLVEAVCQQRVDAAFLEQHTAITALMSGISCKDQPVRVIPIAADRLRLGIGSTFESATAADRIRNEIDTMATEGKLEELFVKWGYLKWGYLSWRNVESVAALLDAQRRARWTMVAAAAFAALCMIAWWQAARAVREKNRTRQAEEKYRCFFDEDLAGYFIAAPDGKLLECNPAFVRMFGFNSREEALAHNLASLYPNPEAQKAFVDLVASRGRLEEYETELRRRDKKPLSVISNVIGSRNQSGKLEEIRGYVIDNTERKKVEEQLRLSQKMDAIGRLAGGVAHDFNNLLTIINGYGDLLLDELKQGDALRNHVSEIRKAGERGAGLTQQLLAFSRKQTIEPKPVNLNALVADSENMLRRVLGEDIEILTLCDDSLRWVVADAGQINQVLVNLAVNARDAMPAGGKLIIETTNTELDASYVERHPGVAPGRYVLLGVTDNGVGMDQQTLQRIFDPFFTTKEQGRGTGLGLSTSYGIVKQNGGFISVYSELGKGTAFRIYLPAIAGGVTAEKEAEPVATVAGGSETILLVEDQEEVRTLVAKVLTSYGYHVLEGSHGEDALLLAKLHPEPIHLLLTDVIMPGMTGRELAERLKQLRPEIKVVYMSGYSENAITHQGLLDPGVDYVPKPFTALSLAGKVREVLARAGSRATILVVDDEAAIRQLFEQLLTGEGYEVLSATNGAEALQIVRGRHLDLVITDLVMPESEGIETIHAIRSEQPSLKIIATSGAFEGRFLRAAALLGACATLLKPIGRDQLLSTVRRVLSITPLPTA
jgi:two-component system cell cycle sensor histidine kinase/response regulator CckA